MEIKPGWEKTKRDSLLTPGVTEVAYLYLKKDEAPWAVVADHTGVVIRGESPKLQGHGDMESFAWVVGDAFREMGKLKRARIVTAN